MRNSEETIEMIMAGLRDAEASPGMEGRILASVEARASERRVATPRWAWAMAMAGVAAALLFIAILSIHRHGQPPAQAQQHVLPAETARDAQPATLLSQKPIEFNKAVAPRRTGARIRSEEAVLLSDLHTPSHPAPEAPLTQEEKLLLRVVHKGDPQVIAMLDPEERARQEAKSEAEFQKFVEQSGKDVHESDQTTE
jgi:hypothetical protein